MAPRLCHRVTVILARHIGQSPATAFIALTVSISAVPELDVKQVAAQSTIKWRIVFY